MLQLAAYYAIPYPLNQLKTIDWASERKKCPQTLRAKQYCTVVEPLYRQTVILLTDDVIDGDHIVTQASLLPIYLANLRATRQRVQAKGLPIIGQTAGGSSYINSKCVCVARGAIAAKIICQLFSLFSSGHYWSTWEVSPQVCVLFLHIHFIYFLQQIYIYCRYTWCAILCVVVVAKYCQIVDG